MYILSILVILSGSIFGASYLKKRAEEILPMTIMGIISLLYIFYVLDALLFGYYITIALCIGLYLISVINVIRKKSYKETLKRMATPGMLVFFMAVGIVYFITRNNIVALWDEMRLWGAYPKILYYNESLQLGNMAALHSSMQSYLPGLALFEYFMAKTAGVFLENHIFVSYSILGISLFMPLTKNINWRRWGAVPLMATIIVIIPLLMNNSYFDYGNYYKSLFIDPLIGLMAGYLMYLVFDNVFRNKFNFIRFLFACTAMSLLKDSGLMFVIVAALGAILLEIVSRRKSKSDNESTNNFSTFFVQMLLIFIVPVAAIVIWKCLIAKYGIYNDLGRGLNLKAVGSFLLHPDTGQKATCLKYLKALISTPLIKSNLLGVSGKMSYFSITGILLIIKGFIYFSIKKGERKAFLITSVFVFISQFIFISGLLFIYVFSFSTSSDLPSFPRYINTVVMMDILFIALVLLKLCFSGGYKEKIINFRLRKATAMAVVLPVFLFPLQAPCVYEYTYSLKDNAEYHAKNIARQMEDKDSCCVYLMTTGEYASSTVFHHRIFFESIDYKICIKNLYKMDVTVPENSSQDSVKTAVSSWLSTLKDGSYEYVYLVNENPLFNKQFSEVFEDDIEAEALYKVNVEGDRVYMTRV